MLVPCRSVVCGGVHVVSSRDVLDCFARGCVCVRYWHRLLYYTWHACMQVCDHMTVCNSLVNKFAEN